VPPSIVFSMLPRHVLDEVCAKLKIGIDTITVAFSNARPDVALSVWKIVHPVKH
ncbi:hypothetical protein B0H17DRAFT_939254, partial [Mycena rosella]